MKNGLNADVEAEKAEIAFFESSENGKVWTWEPSKNVEPCLRPNKTNLKIG